MRVLSKIVAAIFLILPICFSCQSRKTDPITNAARTIQLLDLGAEPHIIFHKGYYYYTQGCEDKIVLWKTTDLRDLRRAEKKEVWKPQDKANSFHLWGPEIHLIDNKWYIYYAADDGNSDNHQLYVIENNSEDPLSGTFDFKGRIATDSSNNWAIHANILQHQGKLFLIWSGWQERRIEKETQHIYIAQMENPWKLSSDRVLISTPEYEWERQWINPDGTKTSYPIYVNEGPQSFHSPKSDKVFIAYSASGNWTPYNCIGLLYADSKSNLLSPASWTKSTEPVFKSNEAESVYGPGSFAPLFGDKPGEYHFLYHARNKPNDEPGAIDSRTPRMQKMKWTSEGMPDFGIAHRPELTP